MLLFVLRATKTHTRNVITMHNFFYLNLVVRKVTGML
jgi:hypothetical protein